MSAQSDPRSRVVSALTAALVVALAAFLPFYRGVFSGHAFYFRDLSAQFFPLRQFVVEGLRTGELRFWNPYTHEGVPLALMPIGYPLDFIQCLWPDEAGLSRLLALHVPLAGLAFLALARRLGLSFIAASGGALVYALGGFCLSTLNLYVYLEAMAWAPLLMMGLEQTVGGSRRHVAVAATFVAVCLSTTGVEIALQAVVLGLVLAGATSWPNRARQLGAVGLGVLLASVVVLPTAALVQGSARDDGFTTDVVLAHSVHPMTFLQVVVPGLYGDPSNLPESFWGQNFFPRGFPYMLSLYLGVIVIALGITGLSSGRPLPRRLLLLGLVAMIACLGRWGGLEPLLDLSPALRKLRYPSKGFFTVHTTAALLAALGLQELLTTDRAWVRFVRVALTEGGLLAGAVFGTVLWPAARGFLLSAFFPPEFEWARRAEAAHWILSDALVCAALALGAAGLGFLVRKGQIPPRRAAVALAALASADLLRAGAGLNPMVSPAFYRLSEATTVLAARIEEEGGRVFTFDPSASSAYFRARDARGGNHETWTFRVLQATFTPEFNVAARVRTALSLDRTMLVPIERVLSPTEAGVGRFPALVDRLRRAGVRHVLSLEPLHDPSLEEVGRVSPAEIAPLDVWSYRLRGPRPLRSLTPLPGVEGSGMEASGIESTTEASDRITLSISTRTPALVVVRDAWAIGWSARVNGRDSPVLRVEGDHRATEVPAGRSTVVFEYSAPGLLPGVGLSALGLFLVIGLVSSGRRDRD